MFPEQCLDYLFSAYVPVSLSIAEFEISTFKSEPIELDYDHIKHQNYTILLGLAHNNLYIPAYNTTYVKSKNHALDKKIHHYSR